MYIRAENYSVLLYSLEMPFPIVFFAEIVAENPGNPHSHTINNADILKHNA